MTKSTAEVIHESIDERLWKEKSRREEAKSHARRSILRIIEKVNGSKLSDEIKQQIEGIHELEILNTILNEIWNVKEMDKIVATIDKYDWLDAINQLDA
jgi:hypothetical protein